MGGCGRLWRWDAGRGDAGSRRGSEGPAPRPPLGRNGVPDKNAPPKNAPPSLGSQFRSPRFWVTLLILLVANVLISNLLFQPSQPKSVNISYTEFKRQVTDGNVSSITAIPRRRSHQSVAPSSISTSATAVICSITSIG